LRKVFFRLAFGLAFVSVFCDFVHPLNFHKLETRFCFGLLRLCPHGFCDFVHPLNFHKLETRFLL